MAQLERRSILHASEQAASSRGGRHEPDWQWCFVVVLSQRRSLLVTAFSLVAAALLV